MAYPERQFVTESININCLADHSIWSTIKNLPPTLPAPCSMNRGPRTGVTWAGCEILPEFDRGVGRILAVACALVPGRVMDGQRQWRVILFGHATSFKSCP